MFKDYYQILGIDRTASEEDIQKAFRKLARKLHPDSNPEHDTHTQFISLNEAYQTLSDPHKRNKYNLKYDGRYIQNIGNNNHYGYSANYSPEPNFSPKTKYWGFRKVKKKDKNSDFLVLVPYVRIIAAITLAWVVFLGLDFVLRYSGPIEYIQDMKVISGPSGEATIEVRTGENKFLLDLRNVELVNSTDLVQLIQTPLLNVVTKLKVWERKSSGEYAFIREFSPHYGIYNVFFFSIILLGLSSIGGLVIRKSYAGFLVSLSLFTIFLLFMSIYFTSHS